MSNRKQIEIAEDLKVRLGALANKTGLTVEEVADQILRDHVDAQDRAIIEQAEDERRWRKYLETGEAHPVEELRSRLQSLAAQATGKPEI